MFKSTVTIPLIRKKVSKKWLVLIAIGLIGYYYFKSKQDAIDAAQLVIGAPGPGQVRITNPNPVRRIARPRTMARRRVVAKPKTTFRKSTPTPTTTPPTIGKQLLQGANQVGQTVGPFLQSQVPSVSNIQSNVNQFVHDVTHPGDIVPHAGAEVSHESDPVRSLKKAVTEDLRLAKLRVAGVG
jgi:hypothetical protein